MVRGVNRTALLRSIKAYAAANGLTYEWDARHGKGSHGRVYLGGKFTAVHSGEIRIGTLTAILKQLGIPRDGLL
jgi:hypothetical protein